MAMGQNPVPPVNIPIPTKIGSKMGGELTYQPKWDPIGFDPQPHVFLPQCPSFRLPDRFQILPKGRLMAKLRMAWRSRRKGVAQKRFRALGLLGCGRVLWLSRGHWNAAQGGGLGTKRNNKKGRCRLGQCHIKQATPLQPVPKCAGLCSQKCASERVTISASMSACIMGN